MYNPVATFDPPLRESMVIRVNTAKACFLFHPFRNLSAVRSYARGPVRTRAPVEHQQVRAPSLKEKLMGPPSANGEALV